MAKYYNNQQLTTTTWLPYEPAKDCSLGVCSSYCLRWCDVVLPQPPWPALLRSGAADGASSARTFSPLVIAVIGFLASAFLLLSYYTIVTKYCGTFSSLRRRDDGGGLELDEEAWPISSPSNGLDEATIGEIAVRKYKRANAAASAGGGTDCAVCLREFEEEESVRVLPKCSHTFHVRCIDTWLRSHCSCPLCRAELLPIVNAPATPGAVSVVENPATDEEEEGAREEADDRDDEGGEGAGGGGRAIDVAEGEDFQPVRRSLSMDFSGGVISSSRWWAAAPEQSNSSGGRLCAMVRSFSSERLSLTRQGKGWNAVLPI